MTNIVKPRAIHVSQPVARPRLRRRLHCLLVPICLSATVKSPAAELSVGTLLMRANSDNQVVVSGTIDGESTIGVTIRVEIRPRPGNRGTLVFTPVDGAASSQRGSIAVLEKEGRPTEVRISAESAAQVDIQQAGDPWPGEGTFSPFDTDRTNAPTLNGSVDDNGTFLPAAVVYRGPLTSFPIRASAGASGVWDVVLATSRGGSSWEGVATTLRHATVTVSPKACASATDCEDGDDCTQDRCDAGICVHEVVDGSCVAQKARKRRGPTRQP